jgi:hypothetical protein
MQAEEGSTALVLRGAHHTALTSFVGGLILIAALQIPRPDFPVWLAMVFFGHGTKLENSAGSGRGI